MTYDFASCFEKLSGFAHKVGSLEAAAEKISEICKDQKVDCIALANLPDELVAGTDPLSAASYLWIAVDHTPTQNVQTLTFPAHTGLTYRIQSSTSLLPAVWTDFRTGIPGIEGLMTLEETNTATRVYYRVGVESP